MCCLFVVVVCCEVGLWWVLVICCLSVICLLLVHYGIGLVGVCAGSLLCGFVICTSCLLSCGGWVILLWGGRFVVWQVFG